MSKITVSDNDLHPHLLARMKQRGIAIQEIEDTLNLGEAVRDAKEGTLGKRLVFQHSEHWEGKWFEEKEVTVYYILEDAQIILLTVIARYGKAFPGPRREP
jgi:hypothetical protein